MNKSVLVSIQPYWVFLIIAQKMGWDIPQRKTIEVRKDYPKDSVWNKVTHIYCSKNKNSFNRIPKQYQPLMEKFLGKVIGEFVCAHISQLNSYCLDGEDRLKDTTCLDDAEIMDYVGYLDKLFYLWHISDLKIYDTPKELGEFKKAGFMTEEEWLYALYPNTHCHYNAWAKRFEITRPPQSWCYVEELKI